MRISYDPKDAAQLPAWLVAAKGGDTKARNAVLTHSLRLIVKLCARFAEKHSRRDLVDDMVQAAVFGENGTTGVAGAILKYDATQGTWATYLTRAVTNACRAVLCDGVITSRGIRWRQARARTVAEDLSYTLGRAPEIAEVCAALRAADGDAQWATTTAVRGMLEAPVIELSWEAETEGSEGLGALVSPTARRCLVDPEALGENDLVAAIDADRRTVRLMLALDSLGERHRELMCRIYGIGREAETKRDAAQAMGLSRARVHDMHEQAVAHIRAEIGDSE